MFVFLIGTRPRQMKIIINHEELLILILIFKKRGDWVTSPLCGGFESHSPHLGFGFWAKV